MAGVTVIWLGGLGIACFNSFYTLCYGFDGVGGIPRLWSLSMTERERQRWGSERRVSMLARDFHEEQGRCGWGG